MNFKKLKPSVKFSIASILFILTLPSIVYFGLKSEYVKMLYSFLVPTLLFLIPFVLFRNLLKWYFIGISFFALLVPSALLTIYYFGDRLDFEMTSLIINTTAQEASELLTGYLPVISVAYVLFIAILIVLFKVLPSKVNFRFSLYVSLTALVVFFTAFIVQDRWYPKTSVKNFALSYFPFDFIKNIHLVHVFNKQSINIKENAHKYKYTNVEVQDKDFKEIYVLIIGETARYDHWQINGYHRATSPLLQQQKNLLSFNNVAASGAVTRFSVPQIITGTHADNFDNYRETGGIIRLFQQAGFKTYWISNQELVSSGTFIHASMADSLILQTNSTHSSKNLNQDLALVEIMSSILELSHDKKSFFVIHTSGSHYNYQARYPISFQKFSPVWEHRFQNPTSKENRELLVNAYDNTILYTDKVINSSIEVLQSYQAISSLIYTSDHGENLFDDKRKFIFHAPNTISKYIAHIPLFVYCSDEYINTFPEKWQNFHNNINRKASNNQVMSTFADMVNISYKEEKKLNSLSSGKFEDSPQKILFSNTQYKHYSELK